MSFLAPIKTVNMHKETNFRAHGKWLYYVHMGILTVSYFDWNNTPIYTRMYKKKIAKSYKLFVLIKMQLCQGYH